MRKLSNGRVGMCGMAGIACACCVAVTMAAEPGDWDRSVAVGVNATSGNSDTLSVHGALTGQREGDTHDIRLGIEGAYAESEVETSVDGRTETYDETTTQNAKAFASYKRKFDRAYVYSDNSILHDDPAGLDARIIVGVGGGRHVLKTERTKVGLELGAAYVWEEQEDEDDDYWALRLAGRHDRQLAEAASFWASAEYLPRSDDVDQYLLNVEAGIEAALNASMSLRLVVQDRYDSESAEGVDENDVSVVGSLVWKL